jgi:hypothetical protein
MFTLCSYFFIWSTLCGRSNNHYSHRHYDTNPCWCCFSLAVFVSYFLSYMCVDMSILTPRFSVNCYLAHSLRFVRGSPRVVDASLERVVVLWNCVFSMPCFCQGGGFSFIIRELNFGTIDSDRLFGMTINCLTSLSYS